MQVGLNLSFATKKWQNPDVLAKIIDEKFNIHDVQFTWDVIDPWWPVKIRRNIAKKYKNAFKKRGIYISSSFGGLASYTYPQLLSREKSIREVSLTYFKRAVDLSSEMEIETFGTPIGGMDIEEYKNEVIWNEIYKCSINSILEIAEYAKNRGIKKILIEPTPLPNEIPNSPMNSALFMEELENYSSIPVLLLIDIGHALFKPLLKNEADILKWINRCKKYIDCLHIQQTDGLLDRHWGFYNKQGIVDENMIKIINSNLKYDIKGYLELIFPFEADSEDIIKEVDYSIKYLNNILGKGGHEI